MSEVIAAFELENLRGEQVVFPGTSDALVCFIKEDCPTCKEVMPVLVAMHKALRVQLTYKLLVKPWTATKP